MTRKWNGMGRRDGIVRVRLNCEILKIHLMNKIKNAFLFLSLPRDTGWLKYILRKLHPKYR